MNNKIKVVIIEDHDLMRLGIRTALARNSAIEVCDEAGTGSAGLRLIEIYSPDIAIVDLQMPDKSGVEVIEAIKNKFKTRIVVASAERRQEAIVEAFKAGADSYYAKSASAEKILEAVLSTYKGESWIDPAIGKALINNIKVNSLIKEEKLIDEHNPQKLTNQESNVLNLIALGLTNAQIADRLCLSSGTVRCHTSHIFAKMDVKNRQSAVLEGIKRGLIVDRQGKPIYPISTENTNRRQVSIR